MFDPNPMHTSNKIMVKCISVKETRLTLSPKVKAIAKKDDNNKGTKIFNLRILVN